MVHGIQNDSTEKLFELVSCEYLWHKDPILRQISIEGCCKMLFNVQLCEQIKDESVEAILATLMVQLFDKKFGTKVTKTKILTEEN